MQAVFRQKNMAVRNLGMANLVLKMQQILIELAVLRHMADEGIPLKAQSLPVIIKFIARARIRQKIIVCRRLFHLVSRIGKRVGCQQRACAHQCAVNQKISAVHGEHSSVKFLIINEF